MLVVDFKKELEDTKKYYKTRHKELISQWEKDPSSCKKLSTPDESFLWTNVKDYYYLDNGDSLDTMITDLSEFKERIEHLVNYPNFFTRYEVEAEEGYIDFNRVYSSYYKPIPLLSDTTLETVAKRVVKNKLENELKPPNVKYKVGIDCKLLSLWLEEVIDYTTLQKLVYSNCSI